MHKEATNNISILNFSKLIWWLLHCLSTLNIMQYFLVFCLTCLNLSRQPAQLSYLTVSVEVSVQ